LHRLLQMGRRVDEIFAAERPARRASRRLHRRPQQLAMAAAVAEVTRRGHTLICEAGTGTGKTFAYLVPA
jgi:ATP-dependent DNA helicase DinG